jgi:hypothetical protein
MLWRYGGVVKAWLYIRIRRQSRLPVSADPGYDGQVLFAFYGHLIR